MSNTVKILFFSANPDDQARFSSEFDGLLNKLDDSIDNDELDFLLPIWDADYEKLLERLKKEHPNVLHYSGHGNEQGICLKNNISGKTQLIENVQLKDIFEGRSEYLKLVILSSGYSSNQARFISEQRIYVLAINAAIDNSVATEFSKNVYLGFTAQENTIKIKKAIKVGCTNFVKNHPEFKDLISLWKNGKEIKYENIQTFNDDDIINSLYNFNFRKQLHCIDQLDNNPLFKVFSFDKNCKDEAKFIFKIFEKTIKNKYQTGQKDRYLQVSVDVIKYSVLLTKNDIIKAIENCIVNIRKGPVIVCVLIDKKITRDNEVIQIINDFKENPPPVNYPCLLFFMPESFNINEDKCEKVPFSAIKSETALAEHLNELKKTFDEWLENYFNYIKDKKRCEDFYNTYIDEFVDIDSYLNSNEKRFLFYFLKGFTEELLGYEIIFDERLTLILDE